MTRELRQRHRRTVLALAVLLPIVFAAGLLARRPIPVMPGSSNLLEPHPAPVAPR